MSDVTSTITSTKDLKRVLGRKELLSIAIGQTIGSGVFALTGVAIAMTGRSANLAMLIAAIFTLAMTVPMLLVSGTIRMRGGFYTQLGLLAHKGCSGFFIIIHILAWSALSMYAISFADYLLALIPGLNHTLVAFVVITAIYLVNMFGIQGAAKLQNAMTLIMSLAITAFAVYGVGQIQPGFFNPNEFMTGGISGLFAAGALLTWAIGGANVVIHLGAEAKNPTKDIPFAIIAGTLIVALFYAVMSTVASGVLPVAEVAGQPLTLVAQRVLPKPLYIFFVVGGAMFALTTTLNSCFGWVTKPILQASVDGWLPKGLSKLNKYKAPYIILTLLYVESLIPIFFRFNISTIGNMAVILNNLFFAIVCYSAINLPKVLPDLWQKSKYHVSHKALVFFSLLGAASSVAQIGLLVGVLTPAEFIGNVAVAVFAVLYAAFMLKSGKVNMEISYEEA
ncbi:APC family permease [Natronincola ferrireducens]|uniref:Basic amino acid/polyamine antiporter, APA family n=1 Tax=Natronincola ferrireducens TaxID=393762 RepID=A0A1G9IRK3_9FIRM|nr:APC family permease [Natronincola ferrireducens]SDL27695.1 basic amino acid/polyamine antiporter, APA family [Natronincola ferrireducens]